MEAELPLAITRNAVQGDGHFGGLSQGAGFVSEPGRAGHFVALGSLAVTLWLVACWLVSGEYTAWRASDSLVQVDHDLRQSIGDMTQGIQRTLVVFHGIPAALSRDSAVVAALLRFDGESDVMRMPIEPRRKALAAHPQLARLNHALASSVEDLKAISVIWLINPAGDAVAASNSGKPESFVGTNYSDRTYFTEAMAGRFGRQFALGRNTNIPGLFFSAPVMDGDRVLGVVAIKIDIPYLSSWVNQANAFLSDNFGVVILAQNRGMEMQTLPGAAVRGLSPAERIGRYKRSEFEELPIVPWGSAEHPNLNRWGSDGVPYLLMTTILPEDDLALTVLAAVPRLATLDQDRLELFGLAGALGSLVIILAGAVTHYWLDRERGRRERVVRQQIEYLATHDVLTGLFSRAVVDQFINHGIAGAKRSGRGLAVLFIDLDDFKEINDGLGHEVGDLVLKEAARRLRQAVREVDVVIRQGGDEFIVLVFDLLQAADAGHVAEKILDALEAPYTITDPPQRLSSSIGIASYPEHGESASLLLRHADMAMYRAKEGGRGGYQFYGAGAAPAG
ncbi:diguanylate cyclase/phosphodiesterase (GGDEF & EAL domains) with PAS/PAC sensor(s) [Paramagnetospirillum magnetotacticum MS-1]|uniref:Diguanylate cyclase/phosphodiesterase (GGDEF & EAL domains) with PAS/PAC sensor(S) n=1 Tax=Paramagnetospirillum magnetotacticum MS-1 TaxID=272627 RepID=A0A0C2YX84_PARME|nr:sensor domain-containing diguanylate cyclase [Paramagnetospirillum magnetotacticum]KIL99300.1 diguanylate cyclase/phosphodiesterase (GGDEF & EAL domains) with PAS/PAC sensor(s) [Paramagnetospirillum magnetotacticum MS-1]